MLNPLTKIKNATTEDLESVFRELEPDMVKEAMDNGIDITEIANEVYTSAVNATTNWSIHAIVGRQLKSAVRDAIRRETSYEAEVYIFGCSDSIRNGNIPVNYGGFDDDRNGYIFTAFRGRARSAVDAGKEIQVPVPSKMRVKYEDNEKYGTYTITYIEDYTILQDDELRDILNDLSTTLGEISQEGVYVVKEKIKSPKAVEAVPKFEDRAKVGDWPMLVQDMYAPKGSTPDIQPVFQLKLWGESNMGGTNNLNLSISPRFRSAGHGIFRVTDDFKDVLNSSSTDYDEEDFINLGQIMVGEDYYIITRIWRADQKTTYDGYNVSGEVLGLYSDLYLKYGKVEDVESKPKGNINDVVKAVKSISETLGISVDRLTPDYVLSASGLKVPRSVVEQAIERVKNSA